MKIGDIHSGKPADAARRAAKNASATGVRFSDLLSSDIEEAAAASTLSDVVAPTLLSPLLSLQEVSEEEVQRKKLVKKGHSLLDKLDKLRSQLLMGEVTADTLYEIQRELAFEKQQVNDPALMAIIDDIELRAAVEEAKLEMAAAAQITPQDLE